MKNFFLFVSAVGIFMAVGYFFIPEKVATEFDSSLIDESVKSAVSEALPEEVIPEVKIYSHVETPEDVMGVYFTSWAAGTKSYQDKLEKIIDTTSINSVVIDIKDYTGKISFQTDNKIINEVGSTETRIRNIEEYFEHLHSKDVYIIGRLAVFQDTHYVNKYPELAVKTLDGNIWRDRKKIPWVEPGAEEYWNYIVEVAKEAHRVGFDEINFDYIRFPSDGNMKDISYSYLNGRTRREVMTSFFEFLKEKMTESEIPYSVDLFGLVTTASDDLGIGQYLEDALPNFDFVMPMVYPSHFADNWYGIPKPGKEPGKVIHLSMKKALERTKTAGYDEKKLRPWIQDFDLGATYTPQLVHDQIQASLSLGIRSFILWDPAIKYQLDALHIKDYDLTITVPTEAKKPPVVEKSEETLPNNSV